VELARFRQIHRQVESARTGEEVRALADLISELPIDGDQEVLADEVQLKRNEITPYLINAKLPTGRLRVERPFKTPFGTVHGTVEIDRTDPLFERALLEIEDRLRAFPRAPRGASLTD
jgi:hypothetical protein